MTNNRDTRDQHITDLRTALDEAVRLLAFSAGRAAADDPEHSARLMAAVDVMTALLTRTAPVSG